MINNNYKNIKCPYCGKSHFSVFHSLVKAVPSIFKITPDPIYKDGVLQNPEIYDPEPNHEFCTCLECNKKFWINTRYENGQPIQSIKTEEQQQEKLNKSLKEFSQKVINPNKSKKNENKESLTYTIDKDTVTYSDTNNTFSITTIKDPVGSITDSRFDTILKKLENLEERLNKLENS